MEQIYRGQKSQLHFQLQLQVRNKFKLLWLYKRTSKYSTTTYTIMECNVICTHVIVHCMICLVVLCSIMSTGHSDSDSVVSSSVTCVDAVTVHLSSQCSGVQETGEVQS